MADTNAGGVAGDEPGTAAEPNPETPNTGTGRARARSRKRVPASPMADVIPGLDLDDLGDRASGTAGEAAGATAPRGGRKATRASAQGRGDAESRAEASAVPAESAEPAPAKRTRRPAKRSAADATPAESDTRATADQRGDAEARPEADTPPAGARRGRATRAAGPPNEDVTGAVAPAASPRVAPTTALVFMAPQPDQPPATGSADAGETSDTETPTARTGRRTSRDRRAPEPRVHAEETTAEADTGEPEEPQTPRTRRSRRGRAAAAEPVVLEPSEPTEDEDDEEGIDEADRRRRRRGRRGRGRGRGMDADESEAGAPEAAPAEEDESGDEEPLTRRRRRRRRGAGGGEADGVTEDGVVTVVRVRPSRDEVQGVTGSTRLEAKRQRRRDGREQRRTRPPILSEAEFLARREAVDRVMVVRQRADRTQVAVLEDGILVEHYVARQTATTMVGNVYLGKVQNVLPSMEAAFVDIGRGRNAVLYAGEVNWDATGLEGRARSIEQALKSGDSVLVQVTKDPVGHKGARLTSHVALSGRHLVYVPNGHASGISRKLSDVERRRLRDILKNLVPDGAGVIVRTAAEGASEEDLARDVKRLQAQWEDIQAKAAAGGAPAVLSAEPDLVIRVVRDLFNEDFREVVIQGTDAYDQVEQYLAHVSPDLVARIRQQAGTGDAFAEWRIDEQILKGLDRRVYLPSGGHLVIDRTEAMTVIDVNTGKYTGAGGNLEETVTRNNLEAAEEIVRQLRLRDVGGIVVIDFIDMVLESNRELVLRRLTECLGRDRTKHQVTEITSLGLVQMTRKRIGQGLLEAFSETCDHCKGRGVVIQTEPVPERPRSNVAERVRAVAASTRLVNQNGTELGMEAVELDESVAADDQGSEADDAALTDVDGGEVFAGEAPEEDADQSSTARRRARRGGGRRRTRP